MTSNELRLGKFNSATRSSTRVTFPRRVTFHTWRSRDATFHTWRSRDWRFLLVLELRLSLEACEAVGVDWVFFPEAFHQICHFERFENRSFDFDETQH